MIGFLDFDDEAVRHLLRALQRHQDVMRINGARMPQALHDLAVRLREVQDGPRVDVPATNLHVEQVLLLDLQDAAEHLGVSMSTVKRLIGNGVLASVRVGSSRRVRRVDLAAYVENLPVGGGEAA